MAFIPLKDFLSTWHFKPIGLIGLRAVSERVNTPSQPSQGNASVNFVHLLGPVQEMLMSTSYTFPAQARKRIHQLLNLHSQVPETLMST